MFDWDKAINERFDKKENTFKILSEAIDEVMSELSDLRTPIKEDLAPASISATNCTIPDIPITEIGWNKLETSEGAEVSGPQRTLLEDYLEKIAPGGDLSTKIKALENFYANGLDEIETEKTTEMISRVLSYLVFYKTLTKVITNFNAASAGFTFEAFLATLLGGSQIKANTGTIADFKTGENIPISLKLYAETTVAVGGSFTDLVRDLTNPKFLPFKGMKYVVCAKGLAGKAGQQEGYIKFYEFDFTLDNIANIIAGASKAHTAANIILPLIDDGAGKYVLAPNVEDLEEPITFSNEEIDEKMKEILNKPDVWEDSGLEDYQIQNIINSPVAGYNTEASLDLTGGGMFYKNGSMADKAKLAPLLTDPKTKVIPGGNSTIKSAIAALNKALRFIIGHQAEVNARRGIGVADLSARGIFPIVPSGKKQDSQQKENVRLLAARSRDWYNQQDEETKKKALRYTMGYLNARQFELNRSESTSPGLVDVIYLGAINIGTKHLETVLQNCHSVLNENVCSIFTSLENLTSNLNSYFANGLEDDSKALGAITAADNIETKTKDVAGTE